DKLAPILECDRVVGYEDSSTHQGGNDHKELECDHLALIPPGRIRPHGRQSWLSKPEAQAAQRPAQGPPTACVVQGSYSILRSCIGVLAYPPFATDIHIWSPPNGGSE